MTRKRASTNFDLHSNIGNALTAGVTAHSTCTVVCGVTPKVKSANRSSVVIESSAVTATGELVAERPVLSCAADTSNVLYSTCRPSGYFLPAWLQESARVRPLPPCRPTSIPARHIGSTHCLRGRKVVSARVYSAIPVCPDRQTPHIHWSLRWSIFAQPFHFLPALYPIFSSPFKCRCYNNVIALTLPHYQHTSLPGFQRISRQQQTLIDRRRCILYGCPGKAGMGPVGETTHEKSVDLSEDACAGSY